MNFSNLSVLQQLYILLASTAVENMDIASNAGIMYSAPPSWNNNGIPDVPKPLSDKFKLTVDEINTLTMVRVTFDKQEPPMNFIPRGGVPSAHKSMMFTTVGDKISFNVSVTRTDKDYSEITNALILHTSKAAEFTIEDASKETLESLLKFLIAEVIDSESDACKALARVIDSYDDVVDSLDSETVRTIVEYRSIKRLWVNVMSSMRLNPDLERYQPSRDCENYGDDRAEITYTSINSTHASTLLGSYISSVPHHNLHTVELSLTKQADDDKYMLALRQKNSNMAEILLSSRLVDNSIMPEDFTDVIFSVLAEANGTTKGPGYVNEIINVMSSMLEQNREFIVTNASSDDGRFSNAHFPTHMPQMPQQMPRY